MRLVRSHLPTVCPGVFQSSVAVVDGHVSRGRNTTFTPAPVLPGSTSSWLEFPPAVLVLLQRPDTQTHSHSLFTILDFLPDVALFFSLLFIFKRTTVLNLILSGESRVSFWSMTWPKFPYNALCIRFGSVTYTL